jgi:hypothetical protein
MNPDPKRPRVRVASPAGILAVIPHLIGFTPEASLVVVGTAAAGGRVEFAFRYDLPDPPDGAAAAEIAAHAAGVLSRHHLTGAVVAGYGPGPLVTPVADAVRTAARDSGLTLKDVLRVEGGRYWSYLCSEPSCCPPEGVPFDAAAHPAGKAMAAAGKLALPSRDALAATVAPLTGSAAAAMNRETQCAERVAAKLLGRAGPRALDGPGLAAVLAAVRLYRDGGVMNANSMHAWLGLVLRRLRVRDDAWARMDPAYRDAHRRLWTYVVRRVQPGYVAPPASLLAVTAWQDGDGALANIALDRALADEPGYSMALLLRDALDAGAPPSMATPPITPEQVTASYSSDSGQDPGEGSGAVSPRGGASSD